MPTGFTAPIFDRDDYTFRDYLWSCMRHMGVAYAIREDSGTDPITTRDIERMKAAESDDYHVTHLAEAEVEMTFALACPSSWWAESAVRKNVSAVDEYARRVADNAAKRSKIEAMLSAVDEWRPPTPDHENFKRFMREQLTETLRFDCYDVEAPTERDADTHRAETLEYLTRNIAYHREAIIKARANATSRTAWIDAVVAITPPPA